MSARVLADDNDRDSIESVLASFVVQTWLPDVCLSGLIFEKTCLVGVRHALSGHDSHSTLSSLLSSADQTQLGSLRPRAAHVSSMTAARSERTQPWPI